MTRGLALWGVQVRASAACVFPTLQVSDARCRPPATAGAPVDCAPRRRRWQLFQQRDRFMLLASSLLSALPVPPTRSAGAKAVEVASGFGGNSRSATLMPKLCNGQGARVRPDAWPASV